uniref:Uncharacterized protein n=1 Tax=Amphimedon queenslandica TaxID=400682 RepID=A0A1X7UY77_AMPQE
MKSQVVGYSRSKRFLKRQTNNDTSLTLINVLLSSISLKIFLILITY